MFIRSQFSTQTFGQLLLQRVTSTDRPCIKVFYDVSMPKGTTVLLRQVKTNGLPTFSVGDARAVHYPNIAPSTGMFQKSRINVSVPLTLLLEVDGPGAGAIPPKVDMKVNLALEFAMIGGSDTVLVEFLNTDQDATLSLIGLDKAQIGGVIGTQPFSLHLLSTYAPVGGVDGITLRHADLALNPQAGRIEFRLELMVDGNPSPDVMAGWSTFYAGNFDAIAPAQAWGVFFDQRIGATTLGRTLRKQVDDVSGFNRDGEPTVSWDQQFPGYRISIDGEVVDACRCLWGLIDLDVTIFLDIKLSIENGQIRIDLWLGHKITDDLEVICCAISAALFFPIVGLESLAYGDIEWYEYFGGLALYPIPHLLFVGALAKMGQINPGLPDVPGFEKDPSDSNHLFTRLPVPRFTQASQCGAPMAPLSIGVLEPRPDGFVVGGPFVLAPVVDPDIHVEATPLKYKPSVASCSGNTHSMEGYYTTITVARQGGSYDFHVCDLILEEPLNSLVTKTISASDCPTTAFITLGIPVLLYESFPVPTVVATSIGGQFFDIPPVPVLSAAERQRLSLAAQIQRISFCYAKSARWRIEWLIDPPELGIDRVRQLWTIAGRVAERAESIVIRSTQGTELARVDTRRDKTFKIAVFDQGSEVIAEQMMHGDNFASSQLSNAQSLMAVDRQMELPSRVLALDSLAIGNLRILVVHQIDRLTFFDVSVAAGLRQLGEIDLRELEWIGRSGNQMVVRNAAGPTMALPIDARGIFARKWAPMAYDTMLPTATTDESWYEAVRDGRFDLLRTRGYVRSDEQAAHRLDGGLLQAFAEGASLALRLDPKTLRADHVSGEGVALITPVGPGRYATVEGYKLLILSSMGRMQL